MNLPVTIDVSLVRRLVAAQFPQWAGLPVRPVEFDGWDNRSFRLGTDMTVRLPSAESYAAQVEKEHRWLPMLAPHLPLPIPVPLAMGAPAEGYPWRWSVYRWLEGESALAARIADPGEFAASLAAFLVALQQINPAGGPPPGLHNFYRGGPLAVYDAETRRAIAHLNALQNGNDSQTFEVSKTSKVSGREFHPRSGSQCDVDTVAATAVWEAALQATWHGPPVWVHGDVAAGNLLVKEGRLSAVIDFGSSAVGDPACDLVIAWTLFRGDGREAFRSALPLDSGAWARARGWALWKALILLAARVQGNPLEAQDARRVIDEVLADHRVHEPGK